jgi:ATP-dependent Clp protease adaptor protein ClpS
VLDAPTLAPTREPAQKGARRKPPMYKVMLHNDNYNRREYVVRVLLKVVEEVRSAEDAAKVMQEAHETGVALVVATAQDKAEEYVEGLRLNGLVSTMEPGH